MTHAIKFKVFKPNKNTYLGVVLKENRFGNTVIQAINCYGPLKMSGFQPGMKIISVNGIPCETLPKRSVVDMIRQSSGAVDLVVSF